MSAEDFDSETLANIRDRDAQTASIRSRRTQPVSDFTERFARFKLTPAQEAEAEAEIARRTKEALDALAAKNREGKWARICPDEFRKPWDWSLLKPWVDRSEVEKVLAWTFCERGLHIVGASGGAKTRAIYALLRRLIIDEHREVTILDGTKFSNQASAAYGDPATTEQWLESLSRVPLLVIDDLAKRWTPATEDAFFDILNRRTSWHRPIITTLNYTANDLQTMSTNRKDGGSGNAKNIVETIMRRIEDYSDTVTF